MNTYNIFCAKTVKDGTPLKLTRARNGYKTVRVWDDSKTYVYQIPKKSSLIDFKRWYKSIDMGFNQRFKKIGHNHYKFTHEA